MKSLPNKTLKKLFKKSHSSDGQAVLIVLLLMAVVLAVALYRVSSSVTDLGISSTDEDSERAFAAAEAGIEEALLTEGTVGTSSIPVTVGTGEDSSEYYVEIDNPTNLGDFTSTPLKNGEEYIVWTVELNSNGMPTCSGDCFNERYFNYLCWGSDGSSAYTGATGANPDPAILLTFYVDDVMVGGVPSWLSTGNFDNVRTVTVGLDPISARTNNNNFYDGLESIFGDDFTHGPGPQCQLNGVSYKYRLRAQNFYSFLSTANGGVHPGGFNSSGFANPPGNVRLKPGYIIMMTVKILYIDDNSEETFAIDQRAGGLGKLPVQGNYFISTGISGDATRKIQVFKSFVTPLDIFLDKAVFSFGNLAK